MLKKQYVGYSIDKELSLNKTVDL